MDDSSILHGRFFNTTWTILQPHTDNRRVNKETSEPSVVDRHVVEKSGEQNKRSIYFSSSSSAVKYLNMSETCVCNSEKIYLCLERMLSNSLMEIS